MISIYLVEDEVYALMALQQKIIDLEEDYTIAGTADNGITALKEIAELCPDIVLTDIRMPDMDGLTLISRLKETGCCSLPIIVSGYQDFEYAKQAVKLGASDYLLKPVNPAELASCLKSCAEKLTRQRKNIVSFLIGEERLSFEGANPQDTFTLLYIIIANPLSSVENPLHPNARYIPNRVLEELFRQFHHCRVLRSFDGFFSNEKALLLKDDEKGRSLLYGNLPHFLKALEAKTGSFVTIYHADAKGMSLPPVIRECRENAVRSVFFGKSGINNVPVRSRRPSPGLSEPADLFALIIGQNQLDLLRSNISRLFGQWESERHSCFALMEDLLFIMDSLKRHFSSQRTLDFNNRYFLENIMSFSRTVPELSENFYLMLVVLFTVKEPEGRPPEELVESLIAYFNDHISSNITLQDLEEKIGVSKVYICRVFKKYKNTTPIDYFTRLKISRARKMLQDFPNLSLREISDSLGFNDAYYFSKVFKRITGFSPSEMRGAPLSRQQQAADTDAHT